MAKRKSKHVPVKPELLAIQTAVTALGGNQAFATALKLQPALVWQWVNGKRPVAAKHCIAIEQATAGKVTRYDLQPEVFGTAEAA